MAASMDTLAEDGMNEPFSYLMTAFNSLICLFIVYILYKIYYRSFDHSPKVKEQPKLRKLRKDLTVQQLSAYDGANQDTEGRILIAVNGKIFDVTSGRQHYGPGRPYSIFAGHDASRGLGTFSMNLVKDEYDDISDLLPHEMEGVMEWETQFTEKYTYVGKLLKPGEEPTIYSDDEEDEHTTNSSANVTDDSPTNVDKPIEKLDDDDVCFTHKDSLKPKGD